MRLSYNTFFILEIKNVFDAGLALAFVAEAGLTKILQAIGERLKALEALATQA